VVVAVEIEVVLEVVDNNLINHMKTVLVNHLALQEEVVLVTHHHRNVHGVDMKNINEVSVPLVVPHVHIVVLKDISRQCVRRRDIRQCTQSRFTTNQNRRVSWEVLLSLRFKHIHLMRVM